MSEILDSGDRTVFVSGAERDMHEGKGDMVSIPWEAILRLSRHYENGPIFLDELNPNAGRMSDEILEDCSIFCQMAIGE